MLGCDVTQPALDATPVQQMAPRTPRDRHHDGVGSRGTGMRRRPKALARPPTVRHQGICHHRAARRRRPRNRDTHHHRHRHTRSPPSQTTVGRWRSKVNTWHICVAIDRGVPTSSENTGEIDTAPAANVRRPLPPGSQRGTTAPRTPHVKRRGACPTPPVQTTGSGRGRTEYFGWLPQPARLTPANELAPRTRLAGSTRRRVACEPAPVSEARRAHPLDPIQASPLALSHPSSARVPIPTPPGPPLPTPPSTAA